MYKEKLLNKILDRDNLNQAFKQVKKNKGAAGVEGMTIHELGAYMAENKEEIISQIRQRVKVRFRIPTRGYLLRQ